MSCSAAQFYQSYSLTLVSRVLNVNTSTSSERDEAETLFTYRLLVGTPEQGYPLGCWLVEFLNPIIIFDYIIILIFEISKCAPFTSSILPNMFPVILGLTLYKFREASTSLSPVNVKRADLIFSPSFS